MQHKQSFINRMSRIIHRNHRAVEEPLLCLAVSYLMSLEVLAGIAEVPLKTFETSQQRRKICHNAKYMLVIYRTLVPHAFQRITGQ